MTRLVLAGAALILLVSTVWKYRERQFHALGQRPSVAQLPDGVSSPDSVRVVAEGRLVTYPGATVTVSAETSGVITQLCVLEKSFVRQGEGLVRLKAADQAAALAEARARVTEAEAELSLAEYEGQRGRTLAAESVISRDELDKLDRNRAVSAARLRTALAVCQRLAALLDKAQVIAPLDGVVLARLVHPGEMVGPGTPLLTIADLERVRVEVEVNEFDAGLLAPGQSARITAESHPGATWSGIVEEIPDAVSERNLRPLDPGRPSDARVLRVKIKATQRLSLKLGQRVEVEIAAGAALARPEDGSAKAESSFVP